MKRHKEEMGNTFKSLKTTISDCDEIHIPILETAVEELGYEAFQEMTAQCLKSPLENIDEFRSKYD